MFERFTDRSRKVIVLAQVEARSFGHDWIGIEHVILGLLGEGEGVAAKVFTELGVFYPVVKAKLAVSVGEAVSEPLGHIPFTDRAKKSLELALREALQLGHNYIGTEHILLGIVREADGPVITAECSNETLFDVSADELRAGVIRMLTRYATARPQPEPEAKRVVSATEAIEFCVSVLEDVAPLDRGAVVAFLSKRYES